MVVHGLGGGPPNFRLARDLSAQTRDDRDLPKLLGHLWKTPGKCNQRTQSHQNLTIKSNQQKITDYIASWDLKALTAPALASVSTLPSVQERAQATQAGTPHLHFAVARVFWVICIICNHKNQTKKHASKNSSPSMIMPWFLGKPLGFTTFPSEDSAGIRPSELDENCGTCQGAWQCKKQVEVIEIYSK